MRIYLIRHGESANNAQQGWIPEIEWASDPPLTDCGRDQARLLADRLRSVPFDHIYTSDLLRARETAEMLRAACSCPLTVQPAFREIDMGQVDGRSFLDFPDWFQTWKQHLEDIPYPEGESGGDVWKRCRPEIDRMLDAAHDRVAVVCHGGTIRSIICGLLNLPQAFRFQLGSPLANTSISILRIKNGETVLHTFNDHAHLDEKLT